MQHDMEITAADANTGVTVRAAINTALQALVSNSSGATEPTTKYAYQFWADTTAGLLKQRNAANTAWITIGTLASVNLGLATLAGNAAQAFSASGFKTSEAANGKQGIAVLVAGAVTIANTGITANSRILLTSQVDGGTVGFLRVSARIAGTSFTITSSNALDTSTVAYEIFEPA